MKIKILVFTHILTSCIGAFIIYVIFIKSNPVEVVENVKYVYIEKNKNEITEKPKIETKQNKKEIVVKQELYTPYYGKIGIEYTLNRSKYQYNNSLNIKANYINNSINIGLGYQYKNFGIDGYLGYDFDNSLSWGFGISYKIFEW